MLRENFERRKTEIQQETAAMLEAVQEMLDTAIACLDSGGTGDLEDILKQVIMKDRKVNNHEEAIYHHCIQLISLEQPVASDLRFSIGVLKFIGDLERIGDHCVHMVKIVFRNSRLESGTDVPKGLVEMADRISGIYRRCNEAIQELDADLAQEIIREDEDLDDVHKAFVKENARMIHSTPELSDSFVNFMFLSRFIERIGDHVVNICEWLVFMREGTRPS
ncbi:phosphate signaling complex protein PhoU [Candidatus Haliotispira prima]|uniref:Phosphate-specific transport system accessory protein PhoU n=1 Tax=Candidatus Haliotispira prima TaxID=3034016 RepID=A0ABY8MGI2_9SPIO|nr:phosphate signaling complex protein PhoU [Candidatus Haliotispira prima]